MRKHESKTAVFLAIACLILSLTGTGFAQASGSSSSKPSEVKAGPYTVNQSIELGYRVVDATGNGSTYNTFVNLQEGPRILEQTFQMRTNPGDGIVFDTFSFANFGYGGDPNNMTSLRVSKKGAYDFRGGFRRDRSWFDYNTLANPLNPTTSNPARILNTSPHLFNTVRRMQDYGLTLFPGHMLQFRGAFSRSRVQGPSYSSFHEGTDVQLFVPYNTTSNNYQFGVDYKPLKKTNISFDQFFTTSKDDNSAFLTDIVWQLSNGTPVSPGLPFNTAINNPCAAPIATGTNTNPPTLNPLCNGYRSYSKTQNSRLFAPTSQLALQSRYWEKLEVSAKLSYTGGDNTMPNFVQFWDANVTRTRARNELFNAGSIVKRRAVTSDIGVTYFLTEKLKINDQFRWYDFRLPAVLNFTAGLQFAQLVTNQPSLLLPAATFNPATCLPTATPGVYAGAGCVPHSTSSGADFEQATVNRYLGEDTKINLVELEYDITPKVGVRAGWKLRTREITMRETETQQLQYLPGTPLRGSCAGAANLVNVNAQGICNITVTDEGSEVFNINENSATFGMWWRPGQMGRFSYDGEIATADKTYVRVSPTFEQRHKIRASVNPTPWASFSGTVNLLANGNDLPGVGRETHSYTSGVSGFFAPKEYFNFDLGWDYEDIYSQTNICYTATPSPGPSNCPGPIALTQALSQYRNHAHSLYFTFMVKPVKRVKLFAGYNLVDTDGNTIVLNPFEPAGPLQYTYQRPTAGLEVELNKYLTFKSNWGYFGYDEKAAPGPVASRDFTGNTGTFSIRYAF